MNIFGTDFSEIVWGTVFSENLYGFGGDDIVVADAGNDYLDGGWGADILYGGTGSDQLVGNDGNDALVGYGGTWFEYDKLWGGTGADNFVLGDWSTSYYLGDGHAVIEDFKWFEGDYIQVSNTSNYWLDYGSYIGYGSFASDTGIYSGTDLIAVVQDVNVGLTNFVTV